MMNAKGKIEITHAVVIVVVVAVIAGAGAFYVTQMRGGQSTEQLKIGALNTMTGYLKFVGTPFLQSEQLAIKKINDAGGVFGENVELYTEDTETSASGAVDAARKLIDVEGVHAIAGAVSTEGTMAIVNVIANNEVPTISPSATSPKLTTADDKDFMFRTCPSDELQGAALAKVADMRGYETVNVLSRDDAYGRGLQRVFSETFEGLDGNVSKKVLYDPKAATFNSYLRNATEGEPDAILLNGLMEDGARMLRTAAELGITEDVEFLCSEGVQNSGIPDRVGKTADGEYIVWKANVGGATPYPEKRGSFVDDYKEEYGEEPVAYCSNVYDAVILHALAAQKAESVNGEDIRDALRDVANSPGEKVSEVSEALSLLREGEEINYQGASSLIQFDSDGNVTVGKARLWYYSRDNQIKIKETIEIPEL